MSRPLAKVGGTVTAETGPLLLSARTLAERLGVSVRTLWRLRTSGKLPQPVRLGGAIRWRAGEIEAWIEAGCPETRTWEARNRESVSFSSR
jgi:excisionase family DNA binding protein